MFRQKFCPRCYGKGIIRDKQTQRWIKCHCNRMLDSDAMAKLVKQDELDKRLEEIKKGSW